MELDQVTLTVVLRNLHKDDNQLSDTCTGFAHRILEYPFGARHHRKSSAAWLNLTR